MWLILQQGHDGRCELSSILLHENARVGVHQAFQNGVRCTVLNGQVQRKCIGLLHGKESRYLGGFENLNGSGGSERIQLKDVINVVQTHIGLAAHTVEERLGYGRMLELIVNDPTKPRRWGFNDGCPLVLRGRFIRVALRTKTVRGRSNRWCGLAVD